MTNQQNQPKLNKKRLNRLIGVVFCISLILSLLLLYLSIYFDGLNQCEKKGLFEGARIFTGSCQYDDLITYIDSWGDKFFFVMITSLGVLAFINIVIPIFIKLKDYLYTKD